MCRPCRAPTPGLRPNRRYSPCNRSIRVGHGPARFWGPVRQQSPPNVAPLHCRPSRQTQQERLASQYIVVSRQGVGTQSEGALSPGGLDLITQRGGDGADDLILDCQNVDRVAVIVFRPQMAAGRRVNQLRANPHAFANPANTAFGQVAHSQVSPHLGDVSVVGPIPGRRVAGDHEQGFETR